MTASSSGCDQPLSVGGLAEDEADDGQPGAQRDRRLEDLDREVRPVLELVERADAEEQPEQPERPKRIAARRWPSVAHRGVAPDREPPDDAARRSTRSRSRAPASPGRRGARPPADRPTSASIGKPNVHLNGRTSARRCAQSGISESGTSRPDSSSSAVKTSSKIGPTRVVQNVTMPEDPVVHRADQVGAPDRDGEDDDVDRARVELRLRTGAPGRPRSAATGRSRRTSSRRSSRGRRGSGGSAGGASRTARPRGSATPSRTGVKMMFMFRTSVQTM